MASIINASVDYPMPDALSKKMRLDGLRPTAKSGGPERRLPERRRTVSEGKLLPLILPQ